MQIFAKRANLSFWQRSKRSIIQILFKRRNFCQKKENISLKLKISSKNFCHKRPYLWGKYNFLTHIGPVNFKSILLSGYFGRWVGWGLNNMFDFRRMELLLSNKNNIFNQYQKSFYQPHILCHSLFSLILMEH